jgi:predicted exporter
LTEAVDATSARRGAWLLAGGLWLIVVLAMAAHQWIFWRQPGNLSTDVLALLPQDERAPEVALATRQLADQASRQIVVMVGAPSWDEARDAAAAFRGAVRNTGWRESVTADGGELAHALDFYRPWRDRLLTAEQRVRLQTASESALVQAALGALHQPGPATRLSDWAADPLGLWPQWWAERAGAFRVRPRDGELSLSADGAEWVVLVHEIPNPAFALDGEEIYGSAIAAGRAAVAAAIPQARTLAAGVPLHAETAATQANREINTIGWGSLAAVLLLVALAFKSLRPIVLVGLSLLIGCGVALSVTAWVFGQVHLMTLVFGASLIGVAEDYGIHYFTMRQSQPGAPPRSLMRHLLPGLVLALVTSVLGYLALGLAPFPGLRQMALFSAVGLIATFITAVCWFPLLDAGTVKSSRFSEAVSASLARWPRLRRTRTSAAVGTVLTVVGVLGLGQLRADDGLRQLQSSPTPLMQAQREVGRLLDAASPIQFYVVHGSSAEQVLQREEALKNRLTGLAGWHALSDWVPSQQRQRDDARLSESTETRVIAAINKALGEDIQRATFAPEPLALERWMADDVSAPARHLWLGRLDADFASVVMLRGLDGPALLPRLAAAANDLPGVRWIDKTAEISSLLARYRVSMTWLLLLSHAVVLLVLWLRYRSGAWRAWLPTAIASALTLALLGWMDQPLQLFNVLALALLLGVGVDYGVFLLEHQGDGSAWLAIVIGGASTWLSFGLLALSSTPALRAFGLTLAIGLVLVGVLAPALRAPNPPSNQY